MHSVSVLKKPAPLIINDPVYDFIRLPYSFHPILSHRYFQRLRNIRQLGLADYVYPAATHSRFQHSLGTAHLMQCAFDSMAAKTATRILKNERTRDVAVAAALLHDIGHTPLSHTLEGHLLPCQHKDLSVLLAEDLQNSLATAGHTWLANVVTEAIRVLEDKGAVYLRQLLASQLDVDRMDYLYRDSFFTGVLEGKVGIHRIINTLQLVRTGGAYQLAVEEKGRSNVESFLYARHLMYEQVYHHKTVLSVEVLIQRIIERAKHLAKTAVCVVPGVLFALLQRVDDKVDVTHYLDDFVQLDDVDVWGLVKWGVHCKTDKIFSILCRMLMTRELFHVASYACEEEATYAYNKVHANTTDRGFTAEEADYFCGHQAVSTTYYAKGAEEIVILRRTGDLTTFSALSRPPNVPTTPHKYFVYSLKACTK